MRHAFLVAPIVLSLAFVGLHCSSDSTSTGSGDAGGAADSAAADSASGDSGTDAAVTLNGCSDADLAGDDRTAATATRTMAFPADPLPAQYTPHCMTIKAGQSVTWNGNFAAHPLEAMGGDPGNPITTTTTGMTASMTFPVAGKFGFDCANHPSLMRGVILVVP